MSEELLAPQDLIDLKNHILEQRELMFQASEAYYAIEERFHWALEKARSAYDGAERHYLKLRAFYNDQCDAAEEALSQRSERTYGPGRLRQRASRSRSPFRERESKHSRDRARSASRSRRRSPMAPPKSKVLFVYGDQRFYSPRWMLSVFEYYEDRATRQLPTRQLPLSEMSEADFKAGLDRFVRVNWRWLREEDIAGALKRIYRLLFTIGALLLEQFCAAHLAGTEPGLEPKDARRIWTGLDRLTPPEGTLSALTSLADWNWSEQSWKRLREILGVPVTVWSGRQWTRRLNTQPRAGREFGALSFLYPRSSLANEAEDLA